MALRKFDLKNKTTCKPENRQQKDKRPREHPNQILTLLNLKKSEKQSKATINKQIQVDITYIIIKFTISSIVIGLKKTPISR